MSASRVDASSSPKGLLLTALVAAVVFWVAYDNASFGLESRAAVAIALWWALIVVVLFGLLPREPASRAALVVGGLLAALALWTLTSILWSPSAEQTFDEFNRVTLYLGAFALVAVCSSHWNVGRWADGLAASIVGIAAVALISRFFPGSFPVRDLPTFLPAVTRLSFPLGYWNGLAIFVALGVPLLLRIAVVSQRLTVRGLALAPMPLIASVIYLSSSRGGGVSALVGAVVFVALTARRWTAAVALALSALGSAEAIVVLADRHALVDGPLGTDLAERQGRSAALLIALICIGTAVVYGVGSRLLARRIRPAPILGWIVLVAILVTAAAAVVAADPVERFRVFKARPGELETLHSGDFVKSHLLSAGGSGRWQNWSAAVDEWRDSPLLGGGAGSYESWWAQHGSIALFVQDAHSLYLETLGELGIVGFGLVLALVLAGVSVGFRRARGAVGDMRIDVAVLTAVFTAYAVAVGIDWMWELTAVSLVAVVALALVVGPATAVPAPLSVVRPDTRLPRMRRFGLGIAVLAVAWALIVAQAVPLLAQRQIAESQAAVGRGDMAEALSAAGAARDIQPWATTPYLQLALASESAGRLRQARMWIGEAIQRNRRDWRLWLVSARVETKLGRVAAADRSLQQAISLNPRSPLLRGLH